MMRNVDTLDMRIIVIVLLIIGLVYYLGWEPLKRYANYGYAYRFNTFMVPLLAIILIPTGVMEVQWQIVQAKGSAIVREVSGNDKGHLKCQRLSTAFIDKYPLYAGYVEHDKPNTAVVKYRECKDLMDYFSNPEKDSIEHTMAFNVLLHEAVHVSGEFDEAVAECRAHQHHVSEAVKMGTDAMVAVKNLKTYISEYYPHLQSKYVSDTGCNGYHHYLFSDSFEL